MRKNKQLELLSTTHLGSQIVPRLEPKQIIKTNNKEREISSSLQINQVVDID